jgi:hypothetical protein
MGAKGDDDDDDDIYTMVASRDASECALRTTGMAF